MCRLMGLIRTDQDEQDMIDSILRSEVVAVDTETTGLHLYQEDVLRGASITTADGSWYLSVTHPDSPNRPVGRLVAALNEADATQVYHHGDFDWAALREADPSFQVPAKLWDTQVADWLMDENQLRALKALGARLFGLDAKKEQRELKALMKGINYAETYKALRQTEEWGKPHPAAPARDEAHRLVAESKKSWATLTAEDIYEYAEQDTWITYNAREQQLADIYDPYDPEVVVWADLEREFQFQRVLYEMIRTGIKVDPEHAEQSRARALARVAEIEAEFPDTNLGSAKQLGDLLYRKWRLTPPHLTDKGAWSTDKAALEELEGDHPGIELILEHRSLTKAIGTYYDSLIEHVGRDGRIHSSFSSTKTVTGRLSSSDPNLQTIPTTFSPIAAVREVFVPEPGTELWEFDLSQAELRVAAGFAGERAMIDAINEGRDLHGETVTSIWGIDKEHSDWDARRRLAKNLNYGFPYGIGPKKFAKYLVVGTGHPVTINEVEEAASILAGYRRTYPALTRLMGGLTREASRLGWIPLHVPGRYRRYKGPGYFNRATYTALNSMVQGGVAEFLKDVMIAADPLMADHGGRTCLQIHDSLVAECVPGQGPVIGAMLQRIADDINPFAMRMVWDSKRWGEKDHD